MLKSGRLFLKGLKLRHLAILISLLIVIAPCAFCWWFVGGDSLIFRRNLPVYPNTREISDTYGYYGAGKGVQRIYFWSSDSIDQIREYYERFTYPFVEDSKKPLRYRSAFNPTGTALPIITAEFGGETLDLGQSRFCYYQLPQQCVMIELIDFEEDIPITLEGLGTWARTVFTPVPPPDDLKGGRLIVYSYYVGDFS